MDRLEVAVGKFIPRFGVLRIAIIYRQVPFRVFGETVDTDKCIFICCRRPMLCPGAFAVADKLFLADELFRLFEGRSVDL